MILFLIACIPDDICKESFVFVDESDSGFTLSTDINAIRYIVPCDSNPPSYDVTQPTTYNSGDVLLVSAFTSEWGWDYLVATGEFPVPWYPVPPVVSENGNVLVRCEYIYPEYDPLGIGGFLQDRYEIIVKTEE